MRMVKKVCSGMVVSAVMASLTTVSAEELQYCLMVRRKDAFCYVYVLKKDVPAESLSLQECEVAAAEWMSPETMDRMVAERTMHRYVYREMLTAYLEN